MGIEPTSEAWDGCLNHSSCCQPVRQAVPKRKDQAGGFGALQPPATILRNTKHKGLPHQEQPLFSGEFELFHKPEGRQQILAANLIDLQRLPESRREALRAFGTTLGQKSIFSLGFQASQFPTSGYTKFLQRRFHCWR